MARCGRLCIYIRISGSKALMGEEIGGGGRLWSAGSATPHRCRSV